MKAFLNRQYFCDDCKKAYSNPNRHMCKSMCKKCLRINCSLFYDYSLVDDEEQENNEEQNLFCLLCKIKCKNMICKSIHQEKVCKKLKVCKKCNYIKNKFNHVCGDNERWCYNCKLSVPFDHKCYILTENEAAKLKKKENKTDTNFNGYIFFDFEAYEDENTHNHIVNLAMAMKVCKSCLNLKLDLINRCEECRKKFTFNSLAEFCDWSLNQKYTIQIAHNLKGYDGVFILNYIINKMLPCDALPKVIANGTKLISIQFRTIKFIDSYCFIPMALSEFSSTFSITELKKGFFPHKFNKPENFNYVGPYPDEEYYQPQFFKQNKKIEFDKWYENHKNNIFKFKKEFYDYCWSDVMLLAEGCLRFRQINMDATKLDANDDGADPFKVAFTIASYCNFIYRRNFMPSNSIAIIPQNGYNPNQQTSIKCQLWLKYISESENIFIQHAKIFR